VKSGGVRLTHTDRVEDAPPARPRVHPSTRPFRSSPARPSLCENMPTLLWIPCCRCTRATAQWQLARCRDSGGVSFGRPRGSQPGAEAWDDQAWRFRRAEMHEVRRRQPGRLTVQPVRRRASPTPLRSDGPSRRLTVTFSLTNEPARAGAGWRWRCCFPEALSPADTYESSAALTQLLRCSVVTQVAQRTRVRRLTTLCGR
jgi:hypothetical protein